MPWSIVNFGDHHGKTLPQIVFTDPDWFFWAIEKKAFSKCVKNASRREKAASVAAITY